MNAMDDRMDNRELMSALADGQLRGEALASGVQAAADAQAREAWCTYHLVGEVLRSGRALVGADPEAFLARVRKGLQQEAMEPAPVAVAGVARPVAAPPVVATPPATAVPMVRVAAAANDRLWKLVAGVASVAAVAAVGWNVWGLSSPTATQPQLAAAGAPPLAQVQAQPQAGTGPMVRDARLDKLLAAHRQLGGGTALGSSSGFLRNATFEGPGR